MSNRRLALWATLILVCLAMACSQTDDPVSGNGNAAVRVYLTDAASDYVAAAEVTISSVQLVPGDDETGFVELLDAEETPATYDLLELQDGVTALLGESLVPAGTYSQLRMIVDDATVTLIDGYEFNDGTTMQTLFVPSGMETGIKVQTSGVIEADEGTVTVMVIDFDVDQSFVIQGDPETPAGINGILFTPELVEVSRAEQTM
jgi:hypothetical protein